MMAQRARPLQLTALFLALTALKFAHAATAPAPAPAVEVSATLPQNLGALCVSPQGIYNLTQAATSTSNQLGKGDLNISIPANLTSSASLQSISNVTWEYIYSYPFPIIAKLFTGSTLNGTLVNAFNLRQTVLSNYTTAIAGPNHDTLYTQAWLDLSQGPQLLTVPAFETGRYWIVPFSDSYLNFYTAIGSHFNSTAGQYLVVGPGPSQNATFPDFNSSRIIHVPTDLTYVLARVLVFNDSDQAAANALSQNITISPYNASGTATKAAQISAAFSGSGYGSLGTQAGYVASLLQRPATWFNKTATYVTVDPPGVGTGNNTAALDTALVQLSKSASSNATIDSLASQIASQCITGAHLGLNTTTGWSNNPSNGYFGANYLFRAQSAISGLGALPPTEAIYFLTNQDSLNRTLDASSGNNYTISFKVPLPAQAFWSLTLYNSTNFLLIQNPINRYNIGDRTSGLVYSGTNNSTLVVFISATQPQQGTANAANWLPAPSNAGFQLILRLYEAPASVLNNDYEPPAVVRTSTTTATATSG
ncbi:hypothetical protein WJX82_007641 [Trebouxia sp. C0006]